jgi:hypothetical protein
MSRLYHYYRTTFLSCWLVERVPRDGSRRFAVSVGGVHAAAPQRVRVDAGAGGAYSSLIGRTSGSPISPSSDLLCLGKVNGFSRFEHYVRTLLVIRGVRVVCVGPILRRGPCELALVRHRRPPVPCLTYVPHLGKLTVRLGLSPYQNLRSVLGVWYHLHHTHQSYGHHF